jgi:hypothetical protein
LLGIDRSSSAEAQAAVASCDWRGRPGTGEPDLLLLKIFVIDWYHPKETDESWVMAMGWREFKEFVRQLKSSGQNLSFSNGREGLRRPMLCVDIGSSAPPALWSFPLAPPIEADRPV